MQDDVALYDTDGPVAVVTMNRPQKRNALSSELKARLVELLKGAEADENIAVVILRVWQDPDDQGEHND